MVSVQPTPRSGGNVTVTGLPQAITLTPTTLCAGGETITFTTDGGDAPAFTTTAIAPSVVQFTQPARTDGTGGDVRVEIAANATGMPGVYQLQLDCRFPATAGSATVPASTLQMLPSNAMGFYDLRGSGGKQLTVGNWIINVVVESVYNNGMSTGAAIRTN